MDGRLIDPFGEATMSKALTDLMESVGGDVDRMLWWLLPAPSERQLRLFACGCCRQVWRLLDPRARQAVGVMESFADGQATAAEVLAVRYVSRPATLTAAESWAAEAVIDLMTWAGADVVHQVAQHAARALRDEAGDRNWQDVRRRQAALFLDIFDSLDPAAALPPNWLRWQDGTVRKLAEAIYQEHRFADVPVLGDALEEAGCDRGEILDHCRRHAEHGRGCWLIDAILGKR